MATLPSRITRHPDLELKLGIKSSLPNARSTLALMILLWESMHRPSVLDYSAPEGNRIVLSREAMDAIHEYLDPVLTPEGLDFSDVSATLNENQLLRSQLESLVVAFELIWKLARIEFVDETKPSSAERTGGVRFPKRIRFTTNMDVIHLTMRQREDRCRRLLLNWLGLLDAPAGDDEETLVMLLTVFSESAVYKLSRDDDDLIFNQDGIYRALSGGADSVDISGDAEPKGSLRMLKTIIQGSLNSFLRGDSDAVRIRDRMSEDLRCYRERVDSFLALSPQNVVVRQASGDGVPKHPGQGRTAGKLPFNRIFFGAPGTGKSYQLNKDAAASFPEANIERVTFYPTYGYAQFVGTYKPVMHRKAGFHPTSQESAVIAVLKDRTLSCQEKYDRLHPALRDSRLLARLPILLGIAADDDGETLEVQARDGGGPGGGDAVGFDHGKAIRRLVRLASEHVLEDRISYEYVPGPFIRTWLRAKRNPDQDHLLIVEELNRANAAAVFGDLFQLLDRKPDGESEYPVTTSEDLRDYLERQLGETVATISIPSNLYVWTTMNSADQGVQPLDTAFKRRWDYTYMDIDSHEEEIAGIRFTVAGSTYGWNDLRKEINRLLVARKVNEDKLIGPFYLKPETLTSGNFVERFCDKILMYLFEDAARQRRDFFDPSRLGVGDNQAPLPETYSSYCKAFREHGPAIFKGIALKGIPEAEDPDRIAVEDPEER